MTIQEYVEKVLTYVGIADAAVTVESAESSLVCKIEVSEELSGMMIGRGGETVHALQSLILATFYSSGEMEGKRLVVDVNKYRERKQDAVLDQLKEIVEQLKVRGGRIALRPMSAEERRMVHVAAKELGLVSISDGDEPYRRVVLSLASDQTKEAEGVAQKDETVVDASAEETATPPSEEAAPQEDSEQE
jgi:spoIIIJ-associated protein